MIENFSQSHKNNFIFILSKIDKINAEKDRVIVITEQIN